MLEKFSPQAIKVIMMAQEEAKKFDSGLVDTEHILLGILKDDNSTAYRVLTERGITLDKVREIVRNIPPLKKYISGAEIHFSNYTKQAFEFAEDEAIRLKDELIESEHILLGLVALGEGNAIQILQDYGINPNRIRWNILRSRKEFETGKETVQTPTLDKYSYDLTTMLEKERVNTIIERPLIIKEVLQSLVCFKSPLVLLVGDTGVGKSSIIKGVTQYIIEGKIYNKFQNFRVIELNIPLLCAESEDTSKVYYEVKNIFNEINQSKDIILVIENINRLFLSPVGSKENVILEQLLAKFNSFNMFPLICTLDKKFYTNPKFLEIEQYFPNTIFVTEPSTNETVKILELWCNRLEKIHNLKIDKNIICSEFINLSKKTFPTKSLPLCAILLLDKLASSKRLNKSIAQVNIRNLEIDLKKLRQEREILANNKDLEGLEKVKVKIKQKEEEIFALNKITNPDGVLSLNKSDIFD